VELGVVSIVGKYRTGKSYFINKVLVDNKAAFQTGNTIQACTKVIFLIKRDSGCIRILSKQRRKIKGCSFSTPKDWGPWMSIRKATPG
jgi:hypothetical protein